MKELIEAPDKETELQTEETELQTEKRGHGGKERVALLTQ